MFGQIISAVSTIIGAKRGTSQMNAANARANQLTAETLAKAEKSAAPYLSAGKAQLPDLQRTAGIGADALSTLAAAYGALGPGRQQQFLKGLEANPLYQAAMAQGQKNILNSAAATGELRGGNTAAALLQLAPQTQSAYLDAMQRGLSPIAQIGTGVGQNLAGQGASLTEFLGNLGANAANVQGDRIRAIGSNQAARTGVLATQYGQLAQQATSALGNLFGGAGGGTSATYGPQQLTNFVSG